MKIYTLFFLFLFLLFEKNLGQIRSNIIIKNDFAFIYVNLSVTSGEFSITSRSLSYNGWSLFAFSTSNSSLNDSLIFLSYINNGNFQIERLIGRNQTLFLQETDVNDTLVLRKRRFISINNQIPTGELNEIFYSLVFNESLFRKTLPFNNNTLYLHLYSDTKDKPVIPMDEVFLNNRIVVTINLQQSKVKKLIFRIFSKCLWYFKVVIFTFSSFYFRITFLYFSFHLVDHFFTETTFKITLINTIYI